MDEGVFAGWLKRDGEAVRAGEPLFSLEGEKATQDVEAIEDGILRIAAERPGARRRRGRRRRDRATCSGPARARRPPPAAGGESRRDRRQRSPRPRRLPRPAPHRPPARDRPRSSPLARRIAPSWASTGRRSAAAAVPAASARPTSLAAARARPSRPMRPRGRSRQPHAPDDRRADGREPSDDGPGDVDDHGRRDESRRPPPAVPGRGADRRSVPSYTDFLVKLAALALRDHPLLNARWAEGSASTWPTRPTSGSRSTRRRACSCR